MEGPARKRVKLEGAPATPPGQASGTESEAPARQSNSDSAPIVMEGASTATTRARSRDGYAQQAEDTDPPSKPRNFDQVRFGDYVLQTWFYSPYPVASSSTTSHPNVAASKQSEAESLTMAHGKLNTADFNGQSNGDLPISGRGSRRHGAQSPEPNGAKGESSLQSPTSDHERPTSTSPHKHPRKHISKPYSEGPSTGSASKGISDATRSLWVCDRCFKYMRELQRYLGHVARCDLRQPPGRKVYQKGTYCIWEVEGSKQKLYCQSLSLFGKLFIDHKTIFFDVDNFLFYVLTEAMPKRDHVMAYFSKERVSYDDYNLACIVTFPMYQGQGFGRLLTELSYYLTVGEASPGTPERPLSELGAKGYEVYWIRKLLRTLLSLVLHAEDEADCDDGNGVGPAAAREQFDGIKDERRVVRETWARKRSEGSFITANDFACPDGRVPDVFPSRSLSLKDISAEAHLREDDVIFALQRTGLDRLKRSTTLTAGRRPADHLTRLNQPDDAVDDGDEREANEWTDVELVISLEVILRACEYWKVRGKGVLDESCCLI